MTNSKKKKKKKRDVGTKYQDGQLSDEPKGQCSKVEQNGG